MSNTTVVPSLQKRSLTFTQGDTVQITSGIQDAYVSKRENFIFNEPISGVLATLPTSVDPNWYIMTKSPYDWLLNIHRVIRRVEENYYRIVKPTRIVLTEKNMYIQQAKAMRAFYDILNDRD